MSQRNDDVGAGWIFILPMTVLMLVFGFLGWWAAMCNRNYVTTKLLALPAPIILSNMIAIPVLLSFSFVYAVLANDKPAFVYIFNNIADLTMFPIWGTWIATFFGWGHIDTTCHIPVWHVVLFQLSIYLSIGHRIARQLTLALLDSASVGLAVKSNVTAYEVRQLRKECDLAYVRASKYYEIRQKAPFWGIVFVWWAGGSPTEYYA